LEIRLVDLMAVGDLGALSKPSNLDILKSLGSARQFARRLVVAHRRWRSAGGAPHPHAAEPHQRPPLQRPNVVKSVILLLAHLTEAVPSPAQPETRNKGWMPSSDYAKVQSAFAGLTAALLKVLPCRRRMLQVRRPSSPNLLTGVRRDHGGYHQTPGCSLRSGNMRYPSRLSGRSSFVLPYRPRSGKFRRCPRSSSLSKQTTLRGRTAHEGNLESRTRCAEEAFLRSSSPGSLTE